MHHTFHIYIVFIKLISWRISLKYLHILSLKHVSTYLPLYYHQKQNLLYICDKFHARFIRLWCGVQSSTICIRCDGFVVTLKLMWRYHHDHVTVSSWHFQDGVTVSCPLKRVRRCLSMKSIYHFDEWCWSKNKWSLQLTMLAPYNPSQEFLRQREWVGAVKPPFKQMGI